MSDYIDNVVIKLKRKYSKDELVQSMIKKQSQLELENGMLKSERDKLEYELNQIKKMDSKTKRDFHQKLYVKNTKKELKALRELCKKLKKENQELWGKLAQSNAT